MPVQIYRIEKNDVFGRFIVANRQIKQGELILKNRPAILGPLADGCVVCFACYKILRNCGFAVCSKCQKAILCSQRCTGKYHSLAECVSLQHNPITSQDIASNGQIITTLRCLLLAKNNPELWSDIMELESHIDQRRDTLVWRKYKLGVEDILKAKGVLSEEDLETELIQKVSGILDVNTFEVRPPHLKELGPITRPEFHCLRALYPEAALMAHDCISNTHLAVDEDFTLTIHASVDIPEGQPIYFNYANTLQGTFQRKEHLREGKYFECNCKRCRDPSELQTELSTLVCPCCKNATLRATKPGSEKEVWKCSKCGKVYKSSIIKMALRECKRRIFDLDPTDAKGIERLLKKLLLTLGRQHYLILEIEQSLIGLYSQRVPNKENLSRKIELCEHLVSIFKIIEPGISRILAVTLYELYAAKISLAHKLYSGRELSGEDFITELLAGEKTLKEAIKMLLYEPPNSPEGALGQNALRELKNLRSSIAQFQDVVLMELPKLTKVDTSRELPKGAKVDTSRELPKATKVETSRTVDDKSADKKKKKNRNKNKK